MKEQPTRDYPLQVHDGSYAFLDGFKSFAGPSFYIAVNRVVRIAVVAELPRTPWPPSFPTEWDTATSATQALQHAFAVTSMTVAPSPDDNEAMSVVRFQEAPELAHTAFWIRREQHAALMDELRTLMEHTSDTSRSSLPSGPVQWVLDVLIPRAELSDYARQMLCLA